MRLRTQEARHEVTGTYIAHGVAAFRSMRDGELMRKEVFGPEDVVRVIERTLLAEEYEWAKRPRLRRL